MSVRHGRQVDPVPSQELLASLATLRRQWVAGLTSQLGTLSALITDRNWRAAREDTHRLRGTAGTHGLHVLGDALATLEQKLESAVGGTVEEGSIGDAMSAVRTAARDATS
jgi:HPt (histidine-containing phosphotransfer) domain-containing protein